MLDAPPEWGDCYGHFDPIGMPRVFMMFRSFVLAAGVSLVLAAQGVAATVFSDDFSTETVKLNKKTLKNFNVDGNVDVVGQNNDFEITTPGGNVVDLDGTRGAGKITSKSSFSFKTGDIVRLDMLVGGAQRGLSVDYLSIDFTFGDAVDVFDWVGSGYFSSVVGDAESAAGIGIALNDFASTNPFAWSSMSFRAGNAGSMTFTIGTRSKDSVGPLLAGVSLDITPAAVPLPATGAVLLLGLGLLAGIRRKRA